MNNADVLIVGLGPTGATLAGLLGQRGLSVAAFDRLPDLYPLPRAIGLDHEAMRIVQELGIAERVRPHVAAYRPSEYRGMDGELIKRLDTVPEPYPLGWAPNYVFDQPAFEKVLRTRLAELPNVQCHLDSEAIDTGESTSEAWVDVKLAGSDQPTRFCGQYVVASDGGSSSIRKRLGLQLEDLDFDEPWLVVDAIVPDAKLAELPQTQVQYCEAERPCTYVVGPGNHRRWEIMLLPGDSLSPQFPEEELWPLLRRWLKPGEAQLWRAAAYRFHGLVAREWRSGRFLLAGDAAHMTPPFMAQGMVQGMRDASNLAWKLERVVNRSSPPELLDTYAQERKPHVTQTTRTAIELGRVICERNADAAITRDTRLREEQGGTIKTMYRQQMIPGLDCGLCELTTPGAGALFPQPKVVQGAASELLDDLFGRGFRLFIDGEPDPKVLDDYQRALAPIAGVVIPVASGSTDTGKLVKEAAPLAGPWLRERHAVAALVRPDHYVYGTARTHAEALVMLERLRIRLTRAVSGR